MITQKANRIQTAFRLDDIVLARVKEAARNDHVSVNEFVNQILREVTKDIESKEEKEASRQRTEAFIERFCGAWVGDETEEEILQAGKSIKGVREVYSL